jgi:hypothetical protein
MHLDADPVAETLAAGFGPVTHSFALHVMVEGLTANESLLLQMATRPVSQQGMP